MSLVVVTTLADQRPFRGNGTIWTRPRLAMWRGKSSGSETGSADLPVRNSSSASPFAETINDKRTQDKEEDEDRYDNLQMIWEPQERARLQLEVSHSSLKADFYPQKHPGGRRVPFLLLKRMPFYPLNCNSCANGPISVKTAFPSPPPPLKAERWLVIA